MFFIILPLLQSDEFFVRFQKGFRIKYLEFPIEEFLTENIRICYVWPLSRDLKRRQGGKNNFNVLFNMREKLGTHRQQSKWYPP